LATESATTAFLAGIGDLVAQTLSHHQNDDHPNEEQLFTIDWSRYQTFVLKGSVSGILWSKWYAFCDPFTLLLAQNLVSTSTDSVSNNIQLLLSILLEQFVWCPILYSLWDIPFPMWLRGDDLKTIPQNVQSTIGNLLIDNAKVWTFANLFIYNIPLQWRVVIVSLTDVVWQSVLSSSIAAAMANSTTDNQDNGIIDNEEKSESIMTTFEEATTTASVAPRRQVSILAQQPAKQSL
jgi:protein Mpv17